MDRAAIEAELYRVEADFVELVDRAGRSDLIAETRRRSRDNRSTGARTPRSTSHTTRWAGAEPR
jgi:hypothetical protein